MKYEGSLQGRWSGRLIDVQGREGTLILDLKQGKRPSEVSGSFDITVASEHAPLRHHGALHGTIEKDHLKLEFKAGKEHPVSIYLEGLLQSLKAGGIGLCATYSVSSKFFSPFQGGVVCASHGRSMSETTIEAEKVISGGVKTPRGSKRRSA